MRIISSPVSAAPVQPVRASDTAENRTHKDQAAANAPRKTSGAPVPTISPKEAPQVWANQGMVDTGVTAQKVFHAVYGDRPESSLTEANRAYTKTDDLRFRDTPLSRQVI